MKTIILKYDESNDFAKKTIDYIISLGLFNVDEEYDKEFVQEIKERMKGKKVSIDYHNIWK